MLPDHINYKYSNIKINTSVSETKMLKKHWKTKFKLFLEVKEKFIIKAIFPWKVSNVFRTLSNI